MVAVLSVSAPVVLHHRVHLGPRVPVPLPAPGLQVQVQDGPQAAHIPLETLHWVPDEDESNQSGIKRCVSVQNSKN